MDIQALSINESTVPIPRIVSIYDENFIPDSVSIYDIKAENVSEWMIENHFSMSPSTPTLIQAQTGMGKSHFVLHELLPAVAAQGHRMLIASNRLAISVQQKREILEILNDPRIDYLTDAGIRNEQNFGPAKVMTLQALASYLRTPEGKEFCQCVNVLVVDEAHFFTADVLFNFDAGWLLHQVPLVFKRAARLYLTATPEDVLVPLARAEANATPPLEERLGLVPPYGTPRQLQFLRFKARGYTHVDFRYFKDMQQLISQIKGTPSGERWLIFVASKKTGNSILEQLNGAQEDARFLSVEAKGTPEWNALLKDQKLSSRILITTAVLDCGVNIHDDSLKHVVILTEDKTSFLQALGRKRCRPGERFTLYIPALDPHRLSGLIHENQRLLTLLADIEQAGTQQGKLFARLWQYGDTAEKALVQIPFYGQLRVNKIAAFLVEKRSVYLRMLLRLIDEEGDSAFPRLVHRWLGRAEDYAEANWLGIDLNRLAQDQLEHFLTQHLEKEFLSDEEKLAFSQTLVSLHAQLGFKPKRVDRSAYLKTQALNNCLRELNSPYHVAKLPNGAWQLKRLFETSPQAITEEDQNE